MSQTLTHIIYRIVIVNNKIDLPKPPSQRMLEKAEDDEDDDVESWHFLRT